MTEDRQILPRGRGEGSKLVQSYGRVSFASGAVIRGSGTGGIGQICSISRLGSPPVMAEVVGFQKQEAVLMPYGDVNGVSALSKIEPVAQIFQTPVGPELIGRVVDGLCHPIDRKGPITTDKFYPCLNSPPEPMARPIIKKPLSLGVRAIDGTLTCGEGQRIGIFAAAGGGKTTLLGSIIQNAETDRCVIALIGERGREVREFVEEQLKDLGLARSVLVVATSDRPAIEQVKAAYTATTLAEYFRDQGERVLLLMDSLTRFARAQRQIGLSAGEPPTRRGFPPSVFERLPTLLERPGLSEQGSITALYTVLVEGDDMNEPVADEVRSLLDGHIILSRKLASEQHYPAIDITSSVSRIMNSIVNADHLAAAQKLRRLLAKYEEVELLLQIGEYEAGSDPETDEAIERRAGVLAFLRQNTSESQSFDETLTQLRKVTGYA
nr:FliI/YscN family ATPase [uncultured Tateyamaria sp.]